MPAPSMATLTASGNWAQLNAQASVAAARGPRERRRTVLVSVLISAAVAPAASAQAACHWGPGHLVAGGADEAIALVGEEDGAPVRH